MVGFAEMVNEMFALYARGDFDAAFDLVDGAERKYPDRESDLIFWQACLLGVDGEPAEALARLREGMDRGHWWPPGQLADSDLDGLRALPGWAELENACATITSEMMRDRPAPIVREGTDDGSVITIQGAHAIQTEVAATWQAAVPAGWTVITPAGAEPTSQRAWGWPRSLESSAESVRRDVEAMDLARPIVVTGFSIGSAIACHIVETGSLDVDGLIVVAPSSPSGFDELRRVATGLPTVIICGDEDPRYPAYGSLREDLAGTPDVDVQLVEGLGHANPDDLSHRVGGFLDELLR